MRQRNQKQIQILTKFVSLSRQKQFVLLCTIIPSNAHNWQQQHINNGLHLLMCIYLYAYVNQLSLRVATVNHSMADCFYLYYYCFVPLLLLVVCPAPSAGS